MGLFRARCGMTTPAGSCISCARPMGDAVPAVAELSNIHKVYGAHVAVEDVSFAVQPGEVFGFLGPNGAGKTTALRILLDIIAPDSGRRQILGAESALSVSARVGYLPEERGLYKNMTAAGVIAYLARLKGMDARGARRRAHRLLERYGLGAIAKKRIKQLSKGMTQKVQVLSALAHDPELLILDEPFSGLDPVNQQVLEDLLADVKAQGRTIIFSTHVMQHAERLCDRIALIAGGRDVFTGTVDAAKALLETRIRLASPDAIAALRGLEGIASIEEIGAVEGAAYWELRLTRGTSVETVLSACMSRNIRLTHFTTLDPSLHDVFVHLVGREQAGDIQETAA